MQYKTVWKYVIEESDEFKIPGGAFLDAVYVGNHWVTWWEVRPDEEPRLHRFKTYGTGHSIPSDARWLQTARDGSFVWHLYELAD